MNTFDDEIGRRVKEAADSGELRSAKGYGKPFEYDAGWESTPAALRMPMKIVKDAGAVPAEVELFRERARIRALLDSTQTADERETLRRTLADIEQKIAWRIEALRDGGAL